MRLTAAIPPALLVALSLVSACSMQKLTGETMVDYTQEHVVPYLMSTDDVDMGCELGVSMGGFLMSFTRVDVGTDKAAILTLLSAGMCAEADAWEAELRRLRALEEGRAAEAKDAAIAEKRAHALAAARNHQAFERTVSAFGHPDDGCPDLETQADQALYMLGLSAGLLGVVHDRLADGAAGVPLEIPRAVERGASCLDSDAWWGVPQALVAAVWTSIPGVAPEGADPWTELVDAVEVGDRAGVAMARGLYVQVAKTNGKEELMCEAIAAFAADTDRVADPNWRLLDRYSAQMMWHEADVSWTRAVGHRAPIDELGCYVPEATDDEGDDDLFDDLGDDEPAAPAPVEAPPAEPTPTN